MKAPSLLSLLLAGACAASSGIVTHDLRCPVGDGEIARRIAEAVVAAHALPDHFTQANYRLDVEDKGQFWAVSDGPRLPLPPVDGAADETVVIQYGGDAFSFRIEKCTGAVSNFSRQNWR